MEKSFTKRISLLSPKQKAGALFAVLFVLLIPSVLVVQNAKTDTRSRAAGSNEVEVRLDPDSPLQHRTNQFTSTISLVKTASRAIIVSGAQAVIDVPSPIFTINSATCSAPFNGTPFTSIVGTRITLFCAISPGSASVAMTSTPTVFGSINLTVNAGAALGPTQLTFVSTRATEAGITNQSPDVSTAGTNASLTIIDDSNSTPTPTSTASFHNACQTVACTNSIPSNCTYACAQVSGQGANECQVASDCIPNPTLVPIGGHCSTNSQCANGSCIQGICGGPSPTVVPASPTTVPTSANSSPTPPFTTDNYQISIGTKDSLTINIVPGNMLMVRFKATLQNVEKTPDLVLRLRVKDELAFTQNPPSTADTCQTPGTGSRDFYIPVSADANGVYSPSSTASVSAPSGAVLAIVGSDGWVGLPGLSQDRFYTFSLKGPKTRGTKMVEHLKLIPNKPGSQDFDWTGNPLFPGDLPDPNSNNKQDCTVNSIDLSLMVNRQGMTDQASLDVADVTYDGVVNGNDISKVVNTLSTKPDDD